VLFHRAEQKPPELLPGLLGVTREVLPGAGGMHPADVPGDLVGVDGVHAAIHNVGVDSPRQQSITRQQILHQKGITGEVLAQLAHSRWPGQSGDVPWPDTYLGCLEVKLSGIEKRIGPSSWVDEVERWVGGGVLRCGVHAAPGQ
jgi:hypothetical protein